MYLFDLGKVPGQQSMLTFHALARMGVEALVIVSPEVPLASIGYFQDAKAEVDLDYCKRAGIPVMRREVGGGATYLDQNQIFYQVIWNKDNPRFPKNVKRIFELLSEPPCETYREFGIAASFRAENDIVTEEGKKIAGEGGGDIGNSMVFVGGILTDFDYRTMSRVLKVPNEKFRDKVYKSMEENLTTMKKELGEVPEREDIVRVLAERFQGITGTLEPASLDADTVEKMMALERWFTSSEFLFKKTPRIPKGIKIKEGVEILYGMFKARGGLIRTSQGVEEKRINEIAISGDFNLYPKSALELMERDLEKTTLDAQTVRTKVEEFYNKQKIEVPGVSPEDFTEAITEATPKKE